MKTRKRCMLVAAFWLAGAHVLAQGADPAATSASTTAVFQVSAVSLLLADKQPPGVADLVEQMGLPALTAGVVGKTLSLAQITELTNTLTQQSRSAGFVVSRVAVTESDLSYLQKTGDLRLHVYPGKLARLTVNNTSKVNAERLRLTLANALCKDTGTDGACDGKPALTAADLERAVLNVQDLPGVSVGRVVFGADEVGVGQTRLEADLQPNGVADQFAVGLDNFGAKTTGRNRLGVSGKASNLFGAGDVLQVYGLVTDQQLYNGGLNFSAPIGYAGLRAVTDVSHLTYSVAGGFAGTADNVLLGLSYPVVRELNNNVRAQLGLSHTNSTSNQSGLTYSDSGLNAVQLLFSGDSGDKAQAQERSFYQWRLAATSGRLGIKNPGQALTDANSVQTAGSYAKLGYGLLVRQNLFDLSGGPYAQLNLRGQAASKNLDGSEKLAFGGPTAVRAYAADNVSVDQGYITSLDARFPLVWGGYRFIPGVFYDLAQGSVNRLPLSTTTANSVTRRGYGLSLDYAPSVNSLVSLIWAAPISAPDGVDNYQVWVSLGLKY